MSDTRTSVGHQPAAPHWTFDESVTEVFDDMLERSIPQYAAMRALVQTLAMRFMLAGDTPSRVVDLGASRGESIMALLSALGAHSRYLCVECAPSMLDALRVRFDGFIQNKLVTVCEHDLRTGLPALAHRSDVVLSILTLQFVPVEYRQTLVTQCYDSLRVGGAMLVVEKVLGETAVTNSLLVDEYLQLKRRNGYSQEDIDRKRLALEGVLVPLTVAGNEYLLRSAGFRDVECFWRALNFVGWLAVKR